MSMNYLITELVNGAFVADRMPDAQTAARGYSPRPVVVAARDCRSTSDVFAAIAQDVLDTDFGSTCKIVIEFDLVTAQEKRKADTAATRNMIADMERDGLL